METVLHEESEPYDVSNWVLVVLVSGLCTITYEINLLGLRAYAPLIAVACFGFIPQVAPETPSSLVAQRPRPSQNPKELLADTYGMPAGLPPFGFFVLTLAPGTAIYQPLTFTQL